MEIFVGFCVGIVSVIVYFLIKEHMEKRRGLAIMIQQFHPQHQDSEQQIKERNKKVDFASKDLDNKVSEIQDRLNGIQGRLDGIQGKINKTSSSVACQGDEIQGMKQRINSYVDESLIPMRFEIAQLRRDLAGGNSSTEVASVPRVYHLNCTSSGPIIAGQTVVESPSSLHNTTTSQPVEEPVRKKMTISRVGEDANLKRLPIVQENAVATL